MFLEQALPFFFPISYLLLFIKINKLEGIIVVFLIDYKPMMNMITVESDEDL